MNALSLWFHSVSVRSNLYLTVSGLLPLRATEMFMWPFTIYLVTWRRVVESFIKTIQRKCKLAWYI